MKFFKPTQADLPIGWPKNVCIVQTLASGVTDTDPYGDCNLGLHVGDAASRVHANRVFLLQSLPEAVRIEWLNQVHGIDTHMVNDAIEVGSAPVDADAMLTTKSGVALAIMTADCMPIMLVSACGKSIAAVHAGWRGLAAGVVETTIARMPIKPAYAWVGPFIGADGFEVGLEVKKAFCEQDARHQLAFSPVTHANQLTKPFIVEDDKFLADLGLILQQKLATLDVEICFLGTDTLADNRFYSYRNGGPRTGRMATLVYRI